jgi:SWI/SNF-related matrix-associated actin-dependent regulator 1 of chromatin subfamily A
MDQLIPLNWSAAKTVETRMGRRTVRTAAPSPEFWAIWKTDKDALRASGYSVSKNPKTGIWEVAHWAATETAAEEKKAKEEAMALSRATDADVDIPVPAGQALLGFQKAGVAYAMSREATLIGDDMGLGKSVQGISVINAMSARRALIICPASLRLNWKKELDKWLITPRRIDVMTGPSEFPKDPEIVICNYDILDRFRDQMTRTEWDLIILDEGHYVKNSTARRTVAIFGQKEKKNRETGEVIPAIPPLTAKRRIVMTGTPIPNRPIEIFSILQYLDPKRWRSRHAFALRYCDAKHDGYGWNYKGASNLEELQRILRETMMVRRRKVDVLKELPPKRRQVITLPANGAAKAIKAEGVAIARTEASLAKAKAEVLLALVNEDKAAYAAAVARLQAAIAVSFAEIAKARHDTAMAKAPYVIEHLQNASDKVIVFCHHHEMVDVLLEGLGAENCVVLTGKTKLEDRQLAVERFQTDESVKYFIGTIGAAGVGHTLTRSSHVVFAELDWVPGNVSQAEDRAHRIGQTDSVLVQHVVLDGSIDARMARTLVSKQEVIDRALDNPVEAEGVAEVPLLPFDWDTAISRLDLDRETEKLFAYRRPTRTDKVDAKAKALGDVELPQEIVVATIQGLRLMTSHDADRAMEKNEVGFNKVDSYIGHELGGRETLTVQQAALARLVLRKYKRQLGTLYDSIFPQ